MAAQADADGLAASCAGKAMRTFASAAKRTLVPGCRPSGDLERTFCLWQIGM